MGHRLLIRLCIFRRHGGIYPIVPGGIPHGFVWFLFGVAPAPFCVVSLFFCWRNANLAGRFAGRRCCRFFSHCQDRALERDRPQQKKKRIAMLVASSSDCSYYCACHNVNSLKLDANRPKAKKGTPTTTKSVGAGHNTRAETAQKRKSNASGAFGTWSIEAR